MKILLANSPSIVSLDNGLEKYFVKAGSRWPFSTIKRRSEPLKDYIPFPFYLAYTTALLKNDNFNVQAIDAVPLNWNHQDFIDYCVNENPDILLIESTTPTFEIDLENIRKISEKIDVKICLAGSHATSYPEEILNNYKGIDYIFQGEYEFHFLEFCQSLRDKDFQRIESLKSIAFKKENGTIYKGEKGLISNLDSLPYPAWSYFPQSGLNTWDYYWDNICQNKPAAQMHSSRGCPFRCDFCVWIQVMYDNSSHRSFSAKRIVDEMEELRRQFGIKEIYFDDDILTGSKKHIKDLCNELVSRKTNIKWSAMGDAMACNKDDAILMSKAGLIAYKFGVESGDPRVLKEIQKPVKLDKVKELCKTFNKCGVKTHATFSFGLSGETKASMNNTLSFMKELTVDTLQVSIATPFPGTRFYDKVKMNNQIVDLNWDDFDGANSSVVSTADLTNKEIQDYAKFALKSWLISRFFTPSWIWRQIKMSIKVLKGQGIGGFLRLLKTCFRVLST